MAWRTRIRHRLDHEHWTPAAVIAAGLVVGLLLAPAVWGIGAPEPATVAVVPIAGFLDGPNAAVTADRLQAARTDGDVEAVVLVINSAGGTAVASEEVYMQVARTADEKPVIAVIDAVGTSGAYKVAVAADEVYVKPGSTVGSVGTTLSRPPEIGPVDDVIDSGPAKTPGATPREYDHIVAMLSGVFVDTVIDQRGDALEVDRTEVERAAIYIGIQAVELGFADEVGDVQSAIQRAAETADVDDYRVRTLGYSGEVVFLSPTAYAAAPIENKSMMGPTDYAALEHDPVVPSVLFVPPGASPVLDPSNASAEVVIDDA